VIHHTDEPRKTSFLAHHDAPLSGERAATRGRTATEGGDERGGAKRSYPFALQPREASRTAATLTRLVAARPPKRVGRTPSQGDFPAARLLDAGGVKSRDTQAGRHLPTVDSLIAATAIAYDLS